MRLDIISVAVEISMRTVQEQLLKSFKFKTSSFPTRTAPNDVFFLCLSVLVFWFAFSNSRT